MVQGAAASPKHTSGQRPVEPPGQKIHTVLMFGWIIAAWLAISGCSVWWMTWLVVEAFWPCHELLAVVSGVLGFVVGTVVLALAHEVAQT